MVLIRTVLAVAFTLFSMTAYLPFGLLAFALGFLGLKKQMTWFCYRIAWFWGKVIILITGCPMEVIGRENIPKQGSVCFVGNHSSVFDIILAVAYIGRPFGFISKKELIFFPFINLWILLLGGLYIDRKNLKKAFKTINQGIKKIQQGNCMLVFPEGTRSKGKGLLPFRSGAIKLATNSLAPIVPMAITGSYNVFEKHYMVHSDPVRVVFCPPIQTADLSPADRRTKLADNVRSVIEQALSN